MKKGDLVFSDKPTLSRHHHRHRRLFERADIVYTWPEKEGQPYLVIDDVCYDVICFVSEGAHNELLGRRWLRCMGPDGGVAVYDANSMRGCDETG